MFSRVTIWRHWDGSVGNDDTVANNSEVCTAVMSRLSISRKQEVCLGMPQWSHVYMAFHENPLMYVLKRPSKDGAHGRMTSQISFINMRKKIISYSVIHFLFVSLSEESGCWVSRTGTILQKRHISTAGCVLWFGNYSFINRPLFGATVENNKISVTVKTFARVS